MRSYTFYDTEFSMKFSVKKIILVSAAFLSAALIFPNTYNPPVGAQNLFNLSSPTQISSASSSAGGGIFMPGADSIVFNPALTSKEQRTQLDAGFTALISTLPNEKSGSAFQTGILIPTKAFVFSGLVNGLFASAYPMNLGDSLNLKAGISKEISEKLSVGLNVNGGLFWGAGSDWSLGADVGVLYDFGDLGFLKNFRLGVSVLNLGKYYNDINLPGVKGTEIAVNFPTLLTTRAGVAALLFETEQFKGGFSFDLATPCFSDLIIDAGLQFSFRDMIFLSIAESIDVVEAKYGFGSFVPSVSLGIKFDFNAKNSEYLRSRSWDSSEMLASLAWQQKYGSLQAISGGARLYLGQKDTVPPVIQIWAGEEE